MITDVSRLISDFKAITASAMPSQLELLTSLKEIIDERIGELQEEIANDSND